MNKKTCILYFTLTPTQEAKTKKWSNSNRVNLHIAKNLYDYSKEQIKKANLPFIEVNETQQKGHDFGEKIVNAINKVFLQGYEDVIVVGNDCINFNKKDIILAQKGIETAANTIGLTKDGGVYLFSIHQSTFSPENAASLKELPWCTNELGQSLLDYLQHIGPVEQLSTKIDIDDEQSLVQALGHHLPLSLLAILDQLFSFFIYIRFYISSIRIPSYILNGLYFRGPPS